MFNAFKFLALMVLGLLSFNSAQARVLLTADIETLENEQILFKAYIADDEVTYGGYRDVNTGISYLVTCVANGQIPRGSIGLVKLAHMTEMQLNDNHGEQLTAVIDVVLDHGMASLYCRKRSTDATGRYVYSRMTIYDFGQGFKPGRGVGLRLKQ